jgi:hypothetical protein
MQWALYIKIIIWSDNFGHSGHETSEDKMVEIECREQFYTSDFSQIILVFSKGSYW